MRTQRYGIIWLIYDARSQELEHKLCEIFPRAFRVNAVNECNPNPAVAILAAFNRLQLRECAEGRNEIGCTPINWGVHPYEYLLVCAHVVSSKES